MAHHTATATPKSGKGKVAGHWVTVDGRALFLRGEKGRESAADHAENARLLRGGTGLKRPSTEIAHRPPKSLREQAAEHRATKGGSGERSRRLLARAQKQFQKAKTTVKRQLKARDVDKADAAVDRTAHHAARMEKLAAPSIHAKWANARVAKSGPYDPRDTNTTVEPGSHHEHHANKTTLRDHVAAHARDGGKGTVAARPAEHYHARRAPETRRDASNRQGQIEHRPTPSAPTPKAAPAPKESLRDVAARHKASNAPGKTSVHADRQWARAKAYQAKGDRAHAEKAFARHDALMTRVARRSDSRPEAEKAKDRPNLRELAAAHSKAKAEKALEGRKVGRYDAEGKWAVHREHDRTGQGRSEAVPSAPSLREQAAAHVRAKAEADKPGTLRERAASLRPESKPTPKRHSIVDDMPPAPGGAISGNDIAGAFKTAHGAAAYGFYKSAADRLNAGKKILFSEKRGTLEHHIQAEYDAGKIKSYSDIKRVTDEFQARRHQPRPAPAPAPSPKPAPPQKSVREQVAVHAAASRKHH